MSVIDGAGASAAVSRIETDQTANQSDAECAHASLHRGLTDIVHYFLYGLRGSKLS